MANSNALLKNLWESLALSRDIAKTLFKTDQYGKLFHEAQLSQDVGKMLDVI